MSDTILVAVISLLGTLVGSYWSNRKSSALIAYRIDQLEEKVNKHNSLIERTYQLESEQAVMEQQIHNVEKRLGNLETQH